MKSAPGIKTHISLGIFYCTLVGLIQGFLEAVILSMSYNGYMLVPADIFKFHLFIVIRKILHFDTGESIPFILDRYIGPDLMDKIPFIFNMVAVYLIVGLIGGICLGIFLWVAFRFVKKSLDYERLGVFYLSFVLSVGVFINLIIWLSKKDITETFSFFGLLINLGILACAFFFTLLIYKMGCNLTNNKYAESDKVVSSGPFVGKSKLAILSVVLITFLALFLNKWVFKDRSSSEILASQMNHGTGSGLTKRNYDNTNVILISIDSLRADHLSSYGYPRKTSPNIDSLASEGVIFSNAFSTTCWTLPSHMSMITSMYSDAHGVITDKDSLDENRVTLAEVLKEQGYTTAAFVSGSYLHSRYGFNQGFDLYDDYIIDESIRAGGDLVQEVTSPKLNKSIQSWLKKNHQKQFFLFLHYFDVHFDYIPPPPYNTMFDPDYKGDIDARNFYHNPRINSRMDEKDLKHVIALYDGEIAFTDEYIGKLTATLKELGIYDNTLIVLTADHGDEFFEHGFKGHKRTLYDEVLRVPLILKFPSDSNLVKNKKVEGIASIVDIMPTILDYLGIRAPEEIQRGSLLPLLNGNKRPKDFLIYARHEYKLIAERSANSKLIHAGGLPKKEYYDLATDPGEKRNLFDQNGIIPEGKEHLLSLVNWLNSQREFSEALPKSDIKKEVQLSDSAKQQLKALGYVN